MDNKDRLRAFQETSTARTEGRARREPGPPDYYIGRRVVDSLAREGKWSTIVACAKGRFRESPDLIAYANSVLEKNASYILEEGQAGILAYLFYNAASKETRAGILDLLSAQGKIDQAKEMLSALADLREWDCIAYCAKELREHSLSEHASLVLEHNAAEAIAGKHEYSMLFLWRNASSDSVRKMALDSLAKAGNKDAVKSLMDTLAMGREWAKLLSMAMGMEITGLRGYAVSLAERSIEQALSQAGPDGLKFIWEYSSSERIRMKVVDRLIGAGDFGSLERLFERMAEKKMWRSMLRAYDILPPGNKGIRSFLKGLMESSLPGVVVSGDAEASAFVYFNSREPHIRHMVFAGLVGAGKKDAAAYLMERIADAGRWDELVKEAGESPLRRNALSLLEKNSRRVISSGQTHAIRYLCRNTGSRGMIVSALRFTGDEEILLMMADKSMWKDIADFARRTKGELRELSISLLEENLGRVLKDDAGAILFLFENAKARGVRERMLRELIAEGNAPAVKLMLELMARRKMWRGLAYCAENMLAGHPGLRMHSLHLMEGDLRSVMEAGSDEAVSFISQNTRRKDVLDRIEGKGEGSGLFRAFGRAARGVRDSLPRFRTA